MTLQEEVKEMLEVLILIVVMVAVVVSEDEDYSGCMIMVIAGMW